MLLMKILKLSVQLKFPHDDVDKNQKHLTISVDSKFSVSDITTPIFNSISTTRSHTDGLNKINACFMSLEDKFNSKISALKAYLIEEIYELKNEIKLHDEIEKVKPNAGEKDKINLIRK